jgi:hypothetical protein
MALTVEEVNEMQDAMFKIDGIDDDKAAADVAKVAEDAAKLAEAKAVEDAAKVKADEEAAAAAAKAKGDDGKAKEGEDDVDAIRELKEQVRASKEALSKATSDYQKLHKIMVDKGLITTEELELTKAEENAAKAAYTERQNKLTEMVTIMELNPTYADVRTVCAQGNLDDIVDAFSRYFVKENGGDLQEVAAKMESEIWSEPNPYKKIYELVKKYHPKFAEAPAKKDDKDDAAKIAAEADGKKKKEVVDAQASAANIGAGGGGNSGSGWTAAKIDAMDEDALHTVPKEIYEKYLLGTLK